jgi:hypothetical protein
MRPWVTLALLVALAAPVAAQGARLIRVAVEFREHVEQRRDAVQGSGSVIVTERGRVRSRVGAGVEGTERTVRRSTGLFTLVQDGGESVLTVAIQVPVVQLAIYRDYATGAGHLAHGVTFREVGTSLKVGATLAAANQIRVRLTPRISYVSPDGSGIVEFTEAAADLLVPAGRPVVLAGGRSEIHTMLRQLLGVAAGREARAVTVVLTATVQ